MKWLKKYYTPRSEKRNNIPSGVFDTILLTIYTGISLYNALQNIISLKTQEELSTGVILLCVINVTSLLRAHISLHRKKKDLYNRVIKESTQTITDVNSKVLQMRTTCIILSYGLCAMLIVCMRWTENEVIFPYGVIPIIVVITTFVEGVSNNLEDIFEVESKVTVG